MIGAVIYYGKNTLVAELPMGTLDLQMKLSSIGVGEPADRIPLKDDEERQLQVKLYASSPEEARLLSLSTPDRTLAYANTSKAKSLRLILWILLYGRFSLLSLVRN